MIVEVKLLESVKEMMRNNPGGGFVSGNTNVYNILKKSFTFLMKPGYKTSLF